MSDSTPVIVAAISGQLLAAHEAILEIRDVFEDVNAGIREGDELVDIIHKAVKLVPDNLKAEAHETLVGTTYWHHPESGSYFTLGDGEKHPAYGNDPDGAMCNQITKAQFEDAVAAQNVSRDSSEDQFEDLL